MDFIDKILVNKKVSVWGGGYLGYTTIIRLQAAGFTVNLFDLGSNRIKGLEDGTFPNLAQRESWSVNGELPLINLSKLKICENAQQMFDSELHIISFPAIETRENNLLTKFKQIILENSDYLNEPLFLFQSAEVPRTIEKFIKELECGKTSWSYASAFRSDWTIEDFLTNNKVQVLAGYDQKSLEKAKAFFDLLEIKHEDLTSIEEAEVYENTQKAASFLLSAFLNQLSLSYPAIDIRKMTKLLIKNIGKQNDLLSIGSLKYNIANSLNHLAKGIKGENYLSILREAESGNVSILFKYADLIKKKGVQSVCILGISSKNTYKDIRFSPSVILAEYLNKIGINVSIDDPHYGKKDILNIFPFAQYIDISRDTIDSDALFVFRDHNNYKFLSQNDLNAKGINNIKIVIDDIGIFENFKFSKNTLYHIPGDGNLNDLN